MSREVFPTNFASGQHLPASWPNKVGRLLNNLGQFTAGSTQLGLRTAGFNADLPQPPAILRPFLVVNIDKSDPNYLPPSHPSYPTQTVLVGSVVNGQPNPIHHTIYETVMLHWSALQIGADPWESGEAWESIGGDLPKQRYQMNVSWIPQQLLVPGDEVYGIWDYAAGMFACVSPPNVRLAKAMHDAMPGEIVRVKVQKISTQPQAPNETISDKVVDSKFVLDSLYYAGATAGLLNAGASAIRTGDYLWIHYIEPFCNWFVLQIIGRGPRFCHFVLVEELTAEMDKASARIELEYGIEPHDAATVPVWNPLAGCTGTTYRFHGIAGCRGQAIWDWKTEKWWIWQLDCSQ